MLFLRNDLIKSSIKYDYWPSDQGVPPTGQGWEQSPNGKWRRPRGAGGAKIASPEPSTHGQVDIGDHDPLTHYKLAKQHKNSGYAEGHAAHVASAKDKTKNLSWQEHHELAGKLKNEGMHEEAKHHLALSAGGASKDTKNKELKEVVEGTTPKAPASAGEYWKRRKNKAQSLVDKYKDKSPEELKKIAVSQHMDKSGKKTPEYKALIALADKKEKESLKEQRSPDNTEDTAVKPSTPFEEAQVSGHTHEAQSLKDNVDSHLDSEDLSEQEKAKLRDVSEALKDHVQVDTVPTDEQKSQVKELKNLAGKPGKEPNLDKDEPSSKERSSKTSFSRLFDRAARAGQQAGQAAGSDYGAGALGQAPLQYAASGAVKMGHKFLTSDSDSKENPKARKKGAEQEQSSMKSFNKAGSAGIAPKTAEQAKLEYKDSFSTEHAGVTGDAALEDDPDVGSKWKHDDENSSSDEVTNELTKKSNPVEMLKSLTHMVKSDLNLYLPNDLEYQFLTEELRIDPVLVKKGLVAIKGSDRTKFNDWMHTRLQKSLGSLNERI